MCRRRLLKFSAFGTSRGSFVWGYRLALKPKPGPCTWSRDSLGTVLVGVSSVNLLIEDLGVGIETRYCRA